MRLFPCFLVLFYLSTFNVDQSEGFGVISATLGVSAGTLALVGGVVLLKAIAVKALAFGAAAGSGGRFGPFGGSGHGRRPSHRGRRAVDEEPLQAEVEEEAAFALLAQSEPEQCYQRLICDLATGKMPESDNDIIIPTLFRGEAEQNSSKFNYYLAAQLGRSIKDVKSCELRYSCSVSLDQVFGA